MLPGLSFLPGTRAVSHLDVVPWKEFIVLPVDKNDMKINENIEVDLQRKINLTKKSSSNNEPIENSLIENFSKNLQKNMGVFSKNILGKDDKSKKNFNFFLNFKIFL